jgi:hypothetical protein
MSEPRDRKRLAREEFGADAHQRVQIKANALASRLRHCSKRELEMLVRYYVHGQDEVEVRSVMRATAEEFAGLRARMRLAAGSAKSGEPPRTKAATAG